MPGIQSINPNTQRKSLSASLGEVSSTSRVLNNEVNTSLYGESVYSQNIEDLPITEDLFQNIKQVDEQNGNFVSMEETVSFPLNPDIVTQKPIDSSDIVNKDYNIFKDIKNQVGNFYNRALEYSSEHKSENGTVHQDNKSSVLSGTELQLDQNTGNYNVQSVENKARYETERDLWGNQSDNMQSDRGDVVSSSNGEPFVIIEEDRGRNSSLDEPGEYSNNDIIRIEVLRAVSPFTFGTRQDFDVVEPRGSQTPMRFYNKNPGRTLGFSADFHQQEYPLEPLLSIAEKAQYLCRPYRHGDYALIPKLVRVRIPGRVFRGYLQSADITYQGDDYRSWSIEEFKPTESKVKGSLPYFEKTSKVNNYYEYPIEENQTNRIRNDTYTEAIDYGLSEISIRFDLLITEEIKLTSYMSDKEKKAIAEAEEDAEKRKRLKEALENATKFLKNHPDYDKYLKPEDLVYVDPDTGEYIGLRFSGDSLINIEGGTTYSEYRNKSKTQQESTENSSFALPNILKQIPSQAMIPGINNTEMLNYLIQQEFKNNPNKNPLLIEKELTEKYQGDSDILFEDYKKSVLYDNLPKEEAEFLSTNYSIKRSPDGKTFEATLNIPEHLKGILSNPLGEGSEGVKREDLDTSFKNLVDFIAAMEEDPKISLGGTFYTINGNFQIIKSHRNLDLEEIHDYIYTMYKYNFENTYFFKKENDFEDCWFDLNNVNTDKVSLYIADAVKASYDGEVKLELEAIKKSKKAWGGLVIVGKNGYDRSFLNVVLSTMRLYRDSIYSLLANSVQELHTLCTDAALSEAELEIPDKNDYIDFMNIIKRRKYKSFPDLDSQHISLRSDDTIIVETIKIGKNKLSRDMKKSYYYNYIYYVYNET